MTWGLFVELGLHDGKDTLTCGYTQCLFWYCNSNMDTCFNNSAIIMNVELVVKNMDRLKHVTMDSCLPIEPLVPHH